MHSSRTGKRVSSHFIIWYILHQCLVRAVDMGGLGHLTLYHTVPNLTNLWKRDFESFVGGYCFEKVWMSNYPFAIRVAQAIKNTHFSHPFSSKSASGFVFQMFLSNFAFLELFSTARKIRHTECRLYIEYWKFQAPKLPFKLSAFINSVSDN